jgi:omega-amidase
VSNLMGDGTSGALQPAPIAEPAPGSAPGSAPAPRTDLRVTLCEVPLVWEDPEANRAALGERLRSLAGSTDLVVLPEMFTTGFSMRSGALAEPPNGPTLHWMQAMARDLGAALYGSVIVEDGARPFNRGLFVTPEGRVTVYDKRHLFRMAQEDQWFAPGAARVVVAWRGWRLLLQICYDLRFPVFSRNRGDYDAILYVANWPAARRLHWQRLLAARAIENLAYVVGVNRIGIDGNGVEYAGDSGVFDVHGERLDAGAANPSPGARLHTVTLPCAPLAAHRARFPAHLDADPFELR